MAASRASALAAAAAVLLTAAAPAAAAPDPPAPARATDPAAAADPPDPATDPAAAADPPDPATDPAAAPDPYRVGPRKAHLAQVVISTFVRSAPGAGERRERLLTEARWGGGPVRLLILKSALDARGDRWLRVRLPDRPNDRAGWVPADRMRLTSTPWRVVVSVSKRTVSVRRGGRLVRRFPAVVGAPATPTPRGLFAISERIRQPPGVLGPWALHLTSHSEVLDDYGGGPGRVAIHGRSGPLLADPLGTAVSHGCIRIENAAVSWLASRAREGIPVAISD